MSISLALRLSTSAICGPPASPALGFSAGAVAGFDAEAGDWPVDGGGVASAISAGCSMLGTFDRTTFSGSLVQAFDTKSP